MVQLAINLLMLNMTLFVYYHDCSSALTWCLLIVASRPPSTWYVACQRHGRMSSSDNYCRVWSDLMSSVCTIGNELAASVQV